MNTVLLGCDCKLDGTVPVCPGVMRNTRRGEGRGKGRGKDKELGGRGTDQKKVNKQALVETTIPPTSNMTDLERKAEENAWAGAVTNISLEKKIGFLKADKALPKGYKGDSLFFHFSVVKNSLGRPVNLGAGSKVKFVLYKAKDGDKEPLEKPKAYAVYVTNRPKVTEEKVKTTKDTKERPKQKVDKPISDSQNLAKQAGQPSLKVSIFWDIENCRPKKNSIILDVVAKIRRLVLQGHQVSKENDWLTDLG